MVRFIVNKLRKYGLYDTKFIKWVKVQALKFVGRNMKKYGVSCLKQFNDIMDEANVKYWADFGTLLGIYREGKFISHDFDIDLAMLEEDYNKDIEDLLVKNGFVKIREFFAYGKLAEQTWKWNGVLVDLFLYQKKDDKMFCYAFYTNGELKLEKINDKVSRCTGMNGQACFVPQMGVKKHDFMGLKVNIPDDPKTYLIENYGPNFMTPDKYWDASKATNIVEIEDIEMEGFMYNN